MSDSTPEDLTSEDEEMAERFATEALEMLKCMRGVPLDRDEIGSLVVFLSWFRRKWGVEGNRERVLPYMNRDASILAIGMELGHVLGMAEEQKKNGGNKAAALLIAESTMTAFAVFGGLFCDGRPEIETVITYCQGILNEKTPASH